MNPFLAAAIAMVLALILPGWVALRGTLAQRLVAMELAAVITALTLACLSLGFAQPSFLDLALALTLLSLPGTLLIAAVLERWL